MTGRLHHITEILTQAMGPWLTEAAPELIYGINRILTRWGRTDDAPTALWNQLDSLLFNTIYTVTNRSMIIPTASGNVRISTEDIREIADRLLTLAYADKTPDSFTKDALFDLSRSGSYAAMRELAERYPLEEDERFFILRVLGENDELQ